MYVSKKWIGKRAYPIFILYGCLFSLHLISYTLFAILYSLKAHQLRSFFFQPYTLLFTLYSLYFTLSTFHFPLTSLPVFAWHATIVLLEAFVEIALIHKADFETNLGDGIFSFED